jgi:site-specific recombinase XerD
MGMQVLEGAADRPPAPRTAEPNPATVYLSSLAPGSRRTMGGALSAIATFIEPGAAVETFRWQQLTYTETAAIRAYLSGKYAPTSANKMIAAMRSTLRQAVALGLMAPEQFVRAVAIGRVRGSRVPAGRALAEDELRALLSVCDISTSKGTRNAALIGILAGAGLRRSEVVDLDLADYEATLGSLRVRGKGNRERLAYLAEGARRAVDAWLAHRGDSSGPLLFPVLKNTRIVRRRMTDQAVLDILRRLAILAQVKRLSPHDFRRTFISELLDRGADIVTVQHLAGHSAVSTTARYDRRGERAKIAAVKLLGVPFPALKVG